MQDLYDKYHIILEGKKRLYIYPLPERLYDLEFTSPVSLKIGNQVFKSSNWGELIALVSRCLQSIKPISIDELLKCRTDWSDAYIFSDNEKINHKEIGPNLYINVNHTALHACWLIVDLLNLYKIDISTTELIIFRAPKAEPDEVKNVVRRNTKDEFVDYLKNDRNFPDVKVDKIIKNIDTLNAKFNKRSSAYNDLYLFSDKLMFASNKANFIKEITSKITSDKQIELIKHYLLYLTNFYNDRGY